METIDPAHATARWYEIGFEGDVADAVHRVTPDAQVTEVPTCTILWSHVRRPAELDALLDTLLSLGLTPREVYESAAGLHQRHGGQAGPDVAASDPDEAPLLYCEVRVVGSLGDPLLRHLGWSHRVAKCTVVRLQTSHAGLRAVLAEMASITRIDYMLAR